MTIENEEFKQAINELSQSMSGASDSAKLLAKQEQAAADAAARYNAAVSNVATSLSKFGSALASGDTGLKNFSAQVDLIQQTSKGLTKLLTKFPGVAKFVDLLVGPAAAGLKLLLSETDALAKTFNEFGQIGALGSAGMQGLIDDFEKSGLTMASYKKVVSENTVTLSRFKGSVKEGISTFVDLTNVLTTLDKEGEGIGQPLRRLGLNLEEVGETAAAYVALQTRLGRSQTMSVADLAKGTVEYAKNLDELSKITGTNKKTLQAQQDAALSETRFRSKIVLENDKKQELSALHLNSIITSLGGDEAGQGYRDLYASGGAALTEASKALVLSAPGIQNAIMKFQNKEIKEEDVVKALQEGLKSTESDRAQTGTQIGDAIYLKFAKTADFVRTDLSQLGKVASTVSDQMKPKDEKDVTENIIKSQQAMEKMSIAIQKAITDTLPTAGAQILRFAAVAQKVTESLIKGGNNAVGVIQDPLAIIGFGETDEQEEKRKSDKNQRRPFGRKDETTPAPRPVPRPVDPARRDQFNRPRPVGGDTPVAQSILNLKGAESTAGGDAVPELLALAQKIQEMYPGARFTALNDTWHQINRPNSQHTKGKALDFTLPEAPSQKAGADIVASLTSMGFKYAEDRYARPSGTGPHIHAQLEKGGVISGPRSGYAAMLHSTEAVVPLPDGRSIPVTNSGGGESFEIQAAQLNALEELVSAMKNQVSISSKMLQYAQ